MPQNRYYSSTAVTTTLTAGITAGATVIPVGAVTGFPLSFPYTLVIDPGTATQEIVTVTGASSLNLTVTRGVDGSTGQSHANAAVAQHDVSARDYNEPQAHIAATTGVHGTTGAIVDTTTAQALTNKTLTSPTINTPTVSGGTFTSPTINSATLDAASTHGGVSGTTLATIAQAVPIVATTLTPGTATVGGGAVTLLTQSVSLVTGGVYRVTGAVPVITGSATPSVTISVGLFTTLPPGGTTVYKATTTGAINVLLQGGATGAGGATATYAASGSNLPIWLLIERVG